MQTRLQRLKDKEARKLVGIVLAGKMAGVAVLLGAMKGVDWYFNSAAGAQTATVVHKANDFVSPINTVWVLVTAFLVFFMQAGFMGLEAGFARSRETVNVLLECVFDTCLCGLLYWSIGFALVEVGEAMPLINGMNPGDVIPARCFPTRSASALQSALLGRPAAAVSAAARTRVLIMRGHYTRLRSSPRQVSGFTN